MPRHDDSDAIRAARIKNIKNPLLSAVSTPPELSSAGEELRQLKRIMETFQPNGKGGFSREFSANFQSHRDTTAQSYNRIMDLAGGRDSVNLEHLGGKNYTLTMPENTYMRVCAHVGYECGSKLSEQGLTQWAECKRQHSPARNL
jgi:hypothetical protein